jgi:hypothetical protein
MQENNSKVEDLWTRKLAGEQLLDSEQQRLADQLSVDDALGQRIARDESTHRMLLAAAPVADDHTWFTHSVLERCEQERIVTPTISNKAVEPPPVESSFELPSVPVKFETPFISHSTRLARARTTKKTGGLSLVRISMIAAGIALIFAAGWYSGVVSTRERQVVEGPARIASFPKTNERVLMRESAFDGVPRTGLATLVNSTRTGGGNPIRAERRIATETIAFQEGENVVELDNGSRLRVVGPAEFQLVSADEISVRHGRVFASVPVSADGLRVITPTSHVVDSGSDYELVVNPRGDTDVLVNRGNVTVVPWPNSSVKSEPMFLTRETTNRVKVFEPPTKDSRRGPLASTTHQIGGAFSGVISVNGESVEFTSPEAFENARKRVNERFDAASERFHENWNKTLQQFRGAAAAGSLNLNGRNIGFQGIDEIIKLQQRMLEQSRQMNRGGLTRKAGSFSGTIDINGETRTFDSAEEFDKAQREAFGPLKTLGIDVFDLPRIQQMMEPEGVGEEPVPDLDEADNEDGAVQRTSVPKNEVFEL